MSPKLRNSILGGVLVFGLGLLLLGPMNILESSTRGAEDCGPIEFTQIAYDNVVCDSGNPNLNAEKNLLEDSPEIMALEPTATEEEIKTAFCADAIADSSSQKAFK